MAPELKRRKLDQDKTCRTARPLAAKNSNEETLNTGSKIDARIQQARDFAVSQAQQEGSKGNFKIFDSPFGNFLVPVVPTRKELLE